MSEVDNEVDMDALFDDEVNVEEANTIIERNLPPQGTYQTNPDESPISVFMSLVVEKDESGAEIGARKVATVTGLGTMHSKGVEHTARLRFGISPDVRKKRDYETQEITDKDDIRTRLWAQAVTTYTATVGEPPKRGTDLLEFLKTVPFRARIFHTSDGEIMVIAVSPVRKQKR